MGRELGSILGGPVNVAGFDHPYVWGVHYQNGFVYASDMANGIWKLRAISR